MLVQLYIIFYGLPRLGIVIGPFPAAVIVFSINEGAYAAETMRAARLLHRQQKQTLQQKELRLQKTHRQMTS